MKTKGIKTTFAFIIGALLACCLGVFGAPIERAFATLDTAEATFDTEVAEIAGSYYLNSYETNADMATASIGSGILHTAETLGTTTGYSKFPLSTGNIKLDTVANQGLFVVGWIVTYDSETLKLYDKDTFRTVTKTIDGTDVEFATTYASNNGDAYAENSSLTISSAFGDVKVEPIYDYIYYNLKLNDNIRTNALPAQDIEVEGLTLYYQSKAEAGNITTYSNVFVNTSPNYTYYSTIETDKTTGTELFVKQIERGAYKINEIVDVDLTIKSGAYLTMDELTFNGGFLTKDATTPTEAGHCYIEKDDVTDLTTRAVAKVKINSDSVLAFEYDSVYKIDVEYYLDGAQIDPSAMTVYDGTLNLLTAVQNNVIFTNAFKVMTDKTQYYIKNSEDNGSKFSISSSDLYSGSSLVYEYTGLNINGVDVNYDSYSFSNVSENKTVQVHFVTKEYKVTYKFVDVDEGAFSLVEGMNVKAETVLKVGETVDAFANISAYSLANLGYEFKGLSLTENYADIQETALTYGIDNVAPKDLTVYVCYTKQAYDLSFDVAVNSLVLKNGNHPIQSIEVYVNGELVKTLTSLSTSVELVKIGKTLKLVPKFSDGFTTELYMPGKEVGGDYPNAHIFANQTGTNNEFEITQETIAEHATGNVFTVKSKEEFVKYTLTYELSNMSFSSTDVYAELSYVLDQVGTDHIAVTAFNNLGTAVALGSENIVKYVFENIYFSDAITMQSKPKDVTTYQLVKYTDNAFILNNDYQSATGLYSYTESIISNDRNIVVEYSVKSVKVTIKSNNDDALMLALAGNVKIKNADSVENLASVSFANYNTTTGFTGADETLVVNHYVQIQVNNVNFGYNLIGYKIKGVSTGVESAILNVDDASRLDSAQDYVITLQFEYVTYKFNIYNTNEPKLQADQTSSVTVKDLALNFNQPYGYYIANAYVELGSTSESLFVGANTDALSSTYSYNFGLNNLRDVVANYGQGTGNNISVDLYVEYVIHTFNVTFGFISDAAYITNNLETLMLPNISVTVQGTPTDADEVVAGRLYFNDIPYGSNIVFTRDETLQLGLSMVGWNDNTDSTISSYSIGSLDKNTNVNYKLALTKYNVSVEVLNLYLNNQTGGNPAFADSSRNKDVYLGDEFEITANPSKNDGFKFFNAYQVYVYNAETWATDYLDLWVYNATNKQLERAGETYNNTSTYYKLYTTNSGELTISFDPANSYIKDGNVKIVFVYDLMKLTLTHETQACADLTAGEESLGYAFRFDESEYATYSYEVFKDGKLVETAGVVDVYNTVKVTVQINHRAENSIDGENYDLALGLQLASEVNVNGVNKLRDSEGNGKYTISFEVGEILPYLADDKAELINLVYQYTTQERQVTVTTNIVDEDFYTNYLSSRTISTEVFDGVPNSETTSNAGAFVPEDLEIKFLGMVSVSYQLSAQGKQYFKISSVKVYDTATKADLTDEYILKKYLIPNMVKSGEIDTTDLANVHVRCMQNVTIELQVQPLIYLGGEVRIGDYTFEKVFKHDNLGNAVQQTLTFGEGEKGSTYDIAGASEILAGMKVAVITDEFRRIETDCLKGLDSITIDSACKNVGTYEIIIRFEFDPASDYACLNNLTLNYRVYLKIQPKEIGVEVDLDSAGIADGQVEQIYDGESDYNDFDSVLWNNIKLVGDGLDVVYTVHADFKFKNVIINVILTADGKVTSQVSPAYYDLELRGFELADNTFNNNFKLSSSTYTLYNFIKIVAKDIEISGLEFYDKIYDSNNDAIPVDLTTIQMSGIVDGDSVDLIEDLDRLKALISTTYDSASIGTGKIITVDVSKAVIGEDASNYNVKKAYITGRKIYPNRVDTEVQGIGMVSLINKRAETTQENWYNYVDLIPINSTLNVNVITENGEGYTDLYRTLSRYITRSNGLTRAYRFELRDAGKALVDISNDLYISVPSTSELRQVLFVTNNNNGEISYSAEGNNIVVDLRVLGEGQSLQYLALMHEVAYLKVWQIILIVIAGVAVITAVVLTVVIIRKKKLKSYELNDKI